MAIWLYRDDVRCPVCKGKFKPVDLDGFEYPGVLGKGLQYSGERRSGVTTVAPVQFDTLIPAFLTTIGCEPFISFAD
jgi:hypothetical protein